MTWPEFLDPLTEAEAIARLRLIRTENIGPITFHQLIGRYGDAQKALEAIPSLSLRGGRKTPLRIPSVIEAKKELNLAEKQGASLLFHGSSAYPKRLSVIDDAPPVLYVRGHRHLLNKATIGFVGTRNASANGITLANRLIAGLGRADYCIASGMAKGIDAAAHKAALQYGTVACMAGGVDVIYPRQNTDLYHAIVEHGCVISEMPMGTEPMARHFPRRNRLISGLSLGVVVVEASLKSGSLITARLAGEQGREVMAVPGSPLDPRSQGSNKLLRDGATLIETADNILDAMDALSRFPLAEPDHLPLFSVATTSSEPDDNAFSAIETLLSPTPMALDDLIRLADLPAGTVQSVLLALELAGRVQRLPGGRIVETPL